MSTEDELQARCGVTYKIKPPIIEDAVYITIVDDEINGQKRPSAMFVNSKNMQSFQWISILMRLISRSFTEQEFPLYIIEELKETYDTGGDYIKTK